MKFKVIKEFVLNGIIQKANTVIELDYAKANLKSIQENIEKVVVNSPSSSEPAAPTPAPSAPVIDDLSARGAVDEGQQPAPGIGIPPTEVTPTEPIPDVDPAT